MPNYAVTGALGAGKTLLAVERAQWYLNGNRAVATNMDLKLENLVNPFAKECKMFRLPDIPTIDDLEVIGKAYEGEFKGDECNGALILEECAIWMNARDYRASGRGDIIKFLVHARKKRWDVYFIVQHIEMLDKQVRDAFCEHIIECKRTDRFKIPLISNLSKLFLPSSVKAPRLHIGTVRYHGVITDRIYYRGNALYDAFDTEQAFEPDEQSVYQMLPPWYVYGRYTTKFKEWQKNASNSSKKPFFLIGGLLGAVLMSIATPDPFEVRKGMFTCNDAWEDLIGCDTTPAQLKRLLGKKGQAKEPSGFLPDTSLSGTSAPETKHPLDNVFISASVKSGSQFIYSFVKDGEVYEPLTDGYREYDMDACRAMLINLNDREDRKEIVFPDSECEGV